MLCWCECLQSGPWCWWRCCMFRGAICHGHWTQGPWRIFCPGQKTINQLYSLSCSALGEDQLSYCPRNNDLLGVPASNFGHLKLPSHIYQNVAATNAKIFLAISQATSRGRKTLEAMLWCRLISELKSCSPNPDFTQHLLHWCSLRQRGMPIKNIRFKSKKKVFPWNCAVSMLVRLLCCIFPG